LIATAECLNYDPKHSNIYTLLAAKSNETVIIKSDCDEQLLMNITFTQNVTLMSITIQGENDGTGPKEIELFVNKLNMGFNNINHIKPTFTTINSDGPVKLPRIHFSNVSSLVIFIRNNHSGGSMTTVTQLQLNGVQKN